MTTFSYCVNAAVGNCMNDSTGTGFVTVADPDGNTTAYGFTAGALTSQAVMTASAVLSETDQGPDLTGGTLLPAWTADGNGNVTSFPGYNSSGQPTREVVPDGGSTPSGTATVTTSYTGLDADSCDGTAQATGTGCQSLARPTTVAPGGVITPPASAPPAGVTYTLYDTDGNQLYSTTGVYEPGAGTAAYSQTTYTLYGGNSVTLGTSATSCNATPPSASLPCATINADGVVTQLGYNAQGDLTSSSTPDGNGTELATTTYGYDADGEQTSVTSPDGNLTGVNAGNFTAITAYDADSEATSVTQAGGTGHTATTRVTSYGFDADGNQTTIDDARGFTTTTTFDADDEATLVTDPSGNASLSCYDGDGNLVQTVPPTGVAASSLTPASCPTSYPSGYSTRLAPDATVSTFDAHRDRVQQTTPAPAGQTGFETTTYAYDGAGNVVKTTAPPASAGGPSQVTVDVYDNAEQLAAETTGSGTSAASTTSYCHDPNGDTTSVVYADGNASSGAAPCETSSPWIVSASTYPAQAAYQTTSSYDSDQELVSSTAPVTTAAPSGATTTETYDAAGNMLTRTDPSSITTTWTYTPLSNTASISYSGSSAHSITYDYDANGNKTSMADATGSSSYSYDPFGELTSATNGASQVTGYGYDADGDVSSVTYPLPVTATWAASDTVTYGYNNQDVLNSVTDFNAHQISITNNGNSLPSSETIGSAGDTISYTYDQASNPSAIALKNSTSTLQSFSYSDSAGGTILSETDTPSSSQSPAAYTYDAKGRVTSMTPGTNSTLNYGFDASSNLTTLPTGAAGTYDKAGELPRPPSAARPPATPTTRPASSSPPPRAPPPSHRPPGTARTS